MGIVRLTAHLDAPIVLDEELHLDGLLESAHPVCRSSPLSRSTPTRDIQRAPIPIYAYALDGARAYLCTSAQFPESARIDGSHVVKRRDGEDIESLAAGVHLGLGPGKNRMHRLQTIVTPTVSWVSIGTRRETLKLARRIQQLGQWRSAGYGIVRLWEAEYVDDQVDPVSVLVDGSRATRHLPASWCQWAEATSIGAHQGPYWHPGRQSQTIVRAGTRCVLLPVVEEAVRAVAHRDATKAHHERKVARRSARRAGAYPPHVLAGGPGAA